MNSEIYNKIIEEQKILCKKYNADWCPSPSDMKIGISKNLNNLEEPINGLRHAPEKDTAGWYIWSGDYSEDNDFFEPIHIYHLKEKFPLILKYLGLPPGWRFQIDNDGYEDIWEDKKLLSS